MAIPDLSVVIPTHDRVDLLQRCLAALDAAISSVREQVEVVVVDDASSDGTWALLEASSGVAAVRRERDGGSSAARNDGVARATAPLILFIDDDIEASPDLLARHLRFHGANTDPLAALVGLVTWTRTMPITPHMRWLERGGPLFAFDTITNPDSVEPAHFCTANVSVKRALLDMVDGPFDPRLRRFTDVELGHRLARAGMQLSHDPQAVGWHLRHDDPASTDARMWAVGRASVELDRLHPGIAPPAAEMTRTRAAKASCARLITPFAPFLPEVLADRIWSARAAWAYAAGRRAAQLEAPQ